MTMLDMPNPATRGATRTSWRDETSLRGVLARLIAEHPETSRQGIKELYLVKTEMVPDLVEEGLTRAFDNDWAALHDIPRQRPVPVVKTAEEIAAEKAAAAAAVAATVIRIRQIVLLDLIQPNGKRLRDCTGVECGKFGAGYHALRDRVGRRLVGNVVDEAEASALMMKGTASANRKKSRSSRRKTTAARLASRSQT